MTTVKNDTNLRYQIYGLDNKGNLSIFFFCSHI